MDDIDQALTRLAQAPLPKALDELEARVLAQIETAPPSRSGLGIGAISIAALALGVIGAGVPASSGTAASLAPIGGGFALAPSTLLAGAP